MSRYLNVFYKFTENGASFSPSKMSHNFFQIDDNVRWKRIIFVRVVFVTFLFRKLNQVESILRTIDVAQGINQCIFSMYHKGDREQKGGCLNIPKHHFFTPAFLHFQTDLRISRFYYTILAKSVLFLQVSELSSALLPSS